MYMWWILFKDLLCIKRKYATFHKMFIKHQNIKMTRRIYLKQFVCVERTNDAWCRISLKRAYRKSPIRCGLVELPISVIWSYNWYIYFACTEKSQTWKYKMCRGISLNFFIVQGGQMMLVVILTEMTTENGIKTSFWPIFQIPCYEAIIHISFICLHWRKSNIWILKWTGEFLSNGFYAFQR